MSEPIPVALREALASVHPRAGTPGEPVVYLRETGSTNDEASRLAIAGAPEGTLVLAGAQTKGRGRQGRQWFSPPHAGLYFSLVLRPAPAQGPVSALVTLMAGVAVAEGIERATGLEPAIKWPNDLVVERPGPAPADPPRRKLAGILAEAAATGGMLQHVVLGVGINVRDSAYPPDLADRVTSIEREVGRRVDEYRILAECVAALGDRWSQMTSGQRGTVLEEWRRRSPAAAGSRVAISTGHGMAQGTTCGLGEDGALCVDVGGTVIRVVSGEVQWL